MKHILFVCTGNSCRSVMAEGLFKKMIGARLEEFSVGSAGINALDGLPSTPETVHVMKEEGVDVSVHRSRRLTLEMIRLSDMIFVMERMHKDQILRMWPQVASKIFLLTDFASDHQKKTVEIDIPDPIRMSDNFYKNVFWVIRDCVTNLVKKLQKDGGR